MWRIRAKISIERRAFGYANGKRHFIHVCWASCICKSIGMDEWIDGSMDGDAGQVANGDGIFSSIRFFHMHVETIQRFIKISLPQTLPYIVTFCTQLLIRSTAEFRQLQSISHVYNMVFGCSMNLHFQVALFPFISDLFLFSATFMLLLLFCWPKKFFDLFRCY